MGRSDHTTKRRRLESAFGELLSALGVDERADVRGTPARAAALWLDELTAGEGVDLGQVLGRGAASKRDGPVVLSHLGVHLVCPHHLTVAFGECHVAYAPAGRIVGFGRVSRLVEAACARLCLQEHASRDIAETLASQLGAEAAVAVIEAVHPCHVVSHGRAHRARVTTVGRAGSPAAARRLEELVSRAARP